MRLSERSIAKAHRVVSERRVREVTAVRTFVVAGDHDTYLVTIDADGATCTCPAYVAHCSHVGAVLLAVGGRPPSPASRAQVDQAPAPVPEARLFTWYWRAALDADPPDGVGGPLELDLAPALPALEAAVEHALREEEAA